MYTQEQLDILHQYTDDISKVKIIPYSEGYNYDLKKWHLIWFHDDDGHYHVIPRHRI